MIKVGCGLSQNEVERIIGKYILGSTSMEIYEEFKEKLKSPDSVLHILKLNNIQRRKAARRSIVKNHDYFKQIDTEEKAYFLGLLIADGSIIQSKSRKTRTLSVSLELKEEDKYIIEKFMKCIEYSSKIMKNRDCFAIRFASQEMTDDLSKYGVVPNKTYKGTFLPELDDSLMPHLIRGIFDGDGTVYFDKNGKFDWGFYGSFKICLDIQNFLNKKIDLIKRKITDKGSVSFVYLHNKYNTKKFYDYIYENASVYLKRKRDKFDSYFANTEVTNKSKDLLEP